MKYVVTLLALLLAGTAFGGPIRDRLAAWRENRPGIIIPKRSGGSCGSCAPAQSAARAGESCPGGVCPLPAANVVARPAATVRYVTVCEGGVCRLVQVRE